MSRNSFSVNREKKFYKQVCLRDSLWRGFFAQRRFSENRDNHSVSRDVHKYLHFVMYSLV